MTVPSAESLPTAPPQKPAARWEDFIDIFYAPAAVFRRRESQSAWPPLLVATALLFGVTFGTFNALAPLIDHEVQHGMAKAMQQNPQMTADIAAASQHWIELSIQWGGVLTPLIILVLALGMWLFGKLVGSRQTFNAAMVVASYTFALAALEPLANGIQALVMNVSSFSSIYGLQLGPARFVDPTTMSPVLFALLVRLNVFVIWRTVLLAIGVRVTGKVSWPSAASVALLVWCVATIAQMRNIISVYG